MVCAKCGKDVADGAAFCPYCGEKMIPGGSGPEKPIYQAEVKRPLRPAGTLSVYRNRTEYATSSVQKSMFNYTGLVAVRKGKLDSIDFITEDGRTESCPVDRKCIHEAFLHIEQAVAPYLAQRKNQLLSQGIRYSFPSSQGLLNDGVLNLSSEQAEFRAKSGKSDVISFQEVKAVTASSGSAINFVLYGGTTRAFAVSKELRDEVLAFLNESIAPYIAQRKAELLAQGIYFSSLSPEGYALNIREDCVEYQGRTGSVADTILFRDVRAVNLYSGALELALTNGTTRSFSVEDDLGNDILAFVRKGIEPYVMARTVGFDAVFGMDERIEFNDARGVFHILRQNGREITEEWPTAGLVRCQWTENKELTTLGSVVSGGITLFKSAAKAAGSQAATDEEERLSSVGVVLTLRDGQPLNVWFGIFPTGLGRSNKKFDQYLSVWDSLSAYLSEHCPECELTGPLQPTAAEPKESATESDPLPQGSDGEPVETMDALGVSQQDDLGIAKYITGVSRFISNCATPMTIAFQGNRVSGGSSILKMLFDQLGPRYGKDLLWLNARQLPQNGSGDELRVLVGKRLVGLLSGEGPSSKQTETLLTNLAALVSGTVAGDSSIGKDMVGGLLSKDPMNSPEVLVREFSKQIDKRCGKGDPGKVVLFIDGLNQLAPARIAELLEAMEDFFDCKGCVFIIAADYANILSGAQGRYDEDTAKHFFDRIFRMSFRVPDSSYNMHSHIKSKLEAMGIQAENEAELELYMALVQNSVGKSVEAVDRLFVSYQLLQDLTGENVYASRYTRLTLFALLCMQNRFRDVYDYAISRRDHVTPDFLAGLCSGAVQERRADQSEAEQAAYQRFGAVLAQVVDLKDDIPISAEKCQAFNEVLELSSVTSQ